MLYCLESIRSASFHKLLVLLQYMYILFSNQKSPLFCSALYGCIVVLLPSLVECVENAEYTLYYKCEAHTCEEVLYGVPNPESCEEQMYGCKCEPNYFLKDGECVPPERCHECIRDDNNTTYQVSLSCISRVKFLRSRNLLSCYTPMKHIFWDIL